MFLSCKERVLTYMERFLTKREMFSVHRERVFNVMN